MRADRLLSIMLLLRVQGRLTMQKLATELEVSRRTILRDIDALSGAGVPVYCEGGRGGGVYLADQYRISLTDLKEEEIRSLSIASLPGPLNDIGLGRANQNSLLKLLASLPSVHQLEIERNRQRILLDPTSWWPNAQPLRYLNDLKTAVFEDWRIEVCYEHGDGHLTETQLEPYSLVAKANIWYLVAAREGQWRTYRVSRFHTVTLLSTHFDRLRTFDLASYWHNQNISFTPNLPQYAFTLRVNQSQLLFIKRHVSENFRLEIQTEEEDNDNKYRVWLELGSLEAAKMLVFGLGTQVVVLEPLELHEAVMKTAAEFIQARDTNKSFAE
jgi:predicted DNA-binding transcriptional regulator YafY